MAAADQSGLFNAVATGAVESEINGGSGAGLVDVTAMSVKATGKSKRTAYVAGPDTRVRSRREASWSGRTQVRCVIDADGQFVDGLAVSALINGGSGAGLVNVDTTTVNANEKSSLTAYVGGGVQVDAKTVSAAAQGGVSASSGFNGGSGAGLANVGTPTSKAAAETAFDAHVGGSAAPVTINALDLTVDAGGNDVTVPRASTARMAPASWG